MRGFQMSSLLMGKRTVELPVSLKGETLHVSFKIETTQKNEK